MENSKKIAILTGATGGLGYAFLKEIEKEPLDEIWALGRNTDRLEIDLTKPDVVEAFRNILIEKEPQIAYLINNAGIAQMKLSKDFTVKEIEDTVDLNCKAPQFLQISACRICKGAQEL